MEKDEKGFPSPTLPIHLVAQSSTVWPKMGSWGPWEALLIPRELWDNTLKR